VLITSSETEFIAIFALLCLPLSIAAFHVIGLA